jgi:hypothetical protein
LVLDYFSFSIEHNAEYDASRTKTEFVRSIIKHHIQNSLIMEAASQAMSKSGGIG